MDIHYLSALEIAEKIKKTIGIDLETKINEVTEENVMPSADTQAEVPKEEVKRLEKLNGGKLIIEKIETENL